MKDSASYNKLWQAKMQDLPLEGDANTAWQKMAGLLDGNMPVAAPVPGAGKPSNFFGSKSLVRVIAALAVLSIILLAYYFIAVHPNTPLKSNSGSAGRADSAQTRYKNDSASSEVNDVNKINGEGNKPASNDSDKNNADTASAKTNLNDTKNSNGSKVNSNANAVVSANNAAMVPGYKNLFTSKRKHNRNAVIRTNNYGSATNNGSSNQAVVSGLNDSANKGQADKTSQEGAGALSSNKVNDASSAPKTTDSANITTKNVVNRSLKNKDTTLTQNKPAQKPQADTTKAKNNKTSAVAKQKANTKSNKSVAYSGFELELKTGFNTNKNATVVPMLGIAGGYYITPKLSVGIGANLFSYRLIEGTYSKSNYGYTTVGDSGKIIQHTADKLTVSSTAKLYTIDIPVMADYRITNWLSVKAGSIISVPLKKPTITSILGPISNPADTSGTYKSIVSAANNSSMRSNVNFGFTGMLTLSFQRFNINGGYLQNFSPYTISSSLGKTSVTYHSFHLGISYLIVQPKKKKKK